MPPEFLCASLVVSRCVTVLVADRCNEHDTSRWSSLLATSVLCLILGTGGRLYKGNSPTKRQALDQLTVCTVQRMFEAAGHCRLADPKALSNLLHCESREPVTSNQRPL